MILAPLFRRSLSVALLTLAMVGLCFSPANVQGRAKPLTREEEIADLERQIAELQKKLIALKKAPTPAPKESIPIQTFPQDWAKALRWRDIGPATMGGRITALAVFEPDPTTFYVATASGGLLKTVNNGTTFEHLFDREATVSIGDVAVANSDRNIVWVGTGENNPRNSVSWGDGVYKSVDGGKKWQNMGLTRSFQIGKILIHPTNPDIVYVGALGRLYGPGGERGVYKTIDGGKNWSRILSTDDNTGVIDMRMHPKEPDTLIVATWERRRDGFDSHAGALASRNPLGSGDQGLEDGYDAYDPIKKWGKSGGIFKTTDGGKTFKKLTKGLPTVATGRIGLDFYQKDPKTLFAIIDTEKIGMGNVPGYLGVVINDAPMKAGAKLDTVTEKGPAEKAGLKNGDIVVSVEGKKIEDGTSLSQAIQAKKPGEQLKLEVLRDKKPTPITVTLTERPEEGGRTGPRRGGTDFRGEDTAEGVKVTIILPGGPSAKAGLQVDDVITTLDKKKVTKAEELAEAYRNAEASKKLVLEVKRGAETKSLEVAIERPTRRRTTRPYAFFYGGQRENVQDVQGPDGQEYGGVYRSDDGGETWNRINSVNPRPMYFSQIRVDPSDVNKLYVLGVSLYRSVDGGKKFTLGGDAGVHADHHAMWINPRDGRHVIIGTDGGTYVTYDRCEKWDHHNNVSIGQFYHVCVDNRKPYRVYGGMQDNGSWGAPSINLATRSASGNVDNRGPTNSDWVMVQGGDGFVCRVDPVDPDIVYAESQEGNLVRHNIRTGERAFIKPRSKAGEAPYRFNWNTPLIVSNHNPAIVYVGGNFVFRSIKRGDEPKVISPELTKNPRSSTTAVAESPKNADVLWAGTDDGSLWVTKDGGTKWENVSSKVGLPKAAYVATIEPSREKDGRCYVCFDGHRSDTEDPLIYVTEDFGQTWKSIRGNLPNGSSRCLREDPFNRDVLYLGTEFAVWASIDRGATWTKINANLPTVAIHELAIHPTAGEMVAATHGRGIWIVDITPVRQLKPSMAKVEASLLTPNTAVRWRRELYRGGIYGNGSREYFADNPVRGAHIYYTLTTKPKKLTLEVKDFLGKTVTTLNAPSDVGMHRVNWNLAGRATGIDMFLPQQMATAMGRAPTVVPAGSYRVVLSIDGKEVASVALKVENDPSDRGAPLIAEDEIPSKPKNRRPED